MTNEVDGEVPDTGKPSEAERTPRASDVEEALEVARSKNALAAECFGKGEYGTAEMLVREALEIEWKLNRSENPDVATYMNNLAAMLQYQGRSDEAEPLIRQALAMRRRLLGDQHLDVANSLNNLGAMLQYQNKVLEAEPLHAEALATQRSLLGDKHPEVAKSRKYLADVLYELGNYSDAKHLYREELAIQREALGDRHPDLVASLHRLVEIVVAIGEYSEAELLCREALAIQRHQLGEEHSDVAAGLDNLAAVVAHQGRLTEAVSLFSEALALRRVLLDSNHDRIAINLTVLAVLLSKQGRFLEAEPLLREELAMRRQLHGNQHPALVRSLGRLAELLGTEGQFHEAESLCREAIAIQRSEVGENYADTVTTLSILATLLYDQGRTFETESLLREAIAILRKLPIEEQSGMSALLNNLAAVHYDQHKLVEAEALLGEALEIERGRCSEEDIKVASTLNNLGSVLLIQGKTADAERVSRRALEIRRELLGDDHPIVGNSLNNVAVALFSQGKHAEAESFHREAIALQRRALSNNDLALAFSLDSLAVSLHCQGRLTEAESLFREAIGIVESVRTQVVGDERDRATMAEKVLLSTIGAYHGLTLIQLQRAPEAADVFERTRSRALLDLLSRSAPELRDQPQGDGDSELKGRLEEALAEESAAVIGVRDCEALLLATMGRRDLGEASKASLLKVQLEAVKKARDRLTNCMREVQGVQDDTWAEAKPLGGREIAEALEPGELLLCFSWAERFVTLLVVPSMSEGPIQGFVLSEQREQVAEWEDVTHQVREKLARPSRDLSSSAHELLETLFQVLLPDELQERVLSADRLIVVPDGPLSKLPLEVLATGEKRFLLDHKLDVAYADSGTVYVNQCRKQKDRGASEDNQVRSAVVLGGCLFDRMPVEALRSGEDRVPDLAMKRGIRDADPHFSAVDQVRLFGSRLRPLPGTAREARGIAKLIRGEPDSGTVVLLIRRDATLPKLEASVKGKRFVHLATHGLTGSVQRPYDASLALTQPVTPTTEDIGFLSLDHLIGHWREKLDDCELVVASACDTQRGIKTGDSTMALAWGFFFAGASSVVASLWKVNDDATALLMMRFYENLLGDFDGIREGRASGQCLPKAIALKEAKRWLRSRTTSEVRELIGSSTEVDWTDWLRTNLLNDPENQLVAEVTNQGVISFRKPGAPRYRGIKITPDARIFHHPYFWSAFVLVGAAE